MILIKNIEMVEVDRDPYEILSTIHPYEAISVYNGSNIEHIEHEVFTELIRGRRFIRPDGKELIIGCSKQAEEVIGIQYESWENLMGLHESTREELYREKGKLLKANEELYAIKQLGFFKRLVLLFKGYP